MVSRWGMDSVLHAGAEVSVNGSAQRDLSTMFFLGDDHVVPPDRVSSSRTFTRSDIPLASIMTSLRTRS
jgi:hypothetical protein